jgi:hypothetical protein
VFEDDDDGGGGDGDEGCSGCGFFVKILKPTIKEEINKPINQ